MQIQYGQKYIIFQIIGTPSAPEKLHWTERTKTTATLSWKPPRSDGGSPIQGYYVEKRRQDGGEFEVANPQICRGLSFTVPNLSEHHMYEFRVKAVNEVGVGEPSNVMNVRIQDDKGLFKSFFLNSINIQNNYLMNF